MDIKKIKGLENIDFDTDKIEADQIGTLIKLTLDGKKMSTDEIKYVAVNLDDDDVMLNIINIRKAKGFDKVHEAAEKDEYFKNWYTNYVKMLTEKGIIDENGNFKPMEPILVRE